MRFVKLSPDTHVNLDALFLVGQAKNGDVEIVGRDGVPIVLGAPTEPSVQVLMTAVNAYSDDTFYNLCHEAAHSWSDARPRPAPKDGEGSQAVPPKSQV